MPKVEHLINQPGSWFHQESVVVKLGALTVFVTPDQASANRIARLLNAARESKHHSAMQILTEQLFLGEESAKLLLHMLHEEHNPIGVHNGKPN